MKQLRVFDAVARLGSVSQAAAEISLTQSATSMALAELEQQLDAPLFHRRAKRLQLNDYGRGLQAKVQQLLQLASEIENSAHAGPLRGRLTLGASTTIGNYLLPALVAEFVNRYPQVEIDLRIGNTEQVIEDMLHLRIDIGFIEGIYHSHKLRVSAWRRDRLCVFCSPGHPLSHKRRLRLADLQHEAWILRESGSGTREIFSLAVGSQISELDVKLELGNSEAIKQAVKTGLALGCLSELAIAAEVKHGELAKLDIKDLDLQRDLFIVSAKNETPSRLVNTLLRYLE